jgi:hypothetical protein
MGVFTRMPNDDGKSSMESRRLAFHQRGLSRKIFKGATDRCAGRSEKHYCDIKGVQAEDARELARTSVKLAAKRQDLWDQASQRWDDCRAVLDSHPLRRRAPMEARQCSRCRQCVLTGRRARRPCTGLGSTQIEHRTCRRASEQQSQEGSPTPSTMKPSDESRMLTPQCRHGRHTISSYLLVRQRDRAVRVRSQTRTKYWPGARMSPAVGATPKSTGRPI